MEHKTHLDSNEGEAPCLCSQRWILGYLGFAYGAVLTIFRIDMSIAVVCMTGVTVNHTQLQNNNFVNATQLPDVTRINSLLNVNSKGAAVFMGDLTTNHSDIYQLKGVVRSYKTNRDTSGPDGWLGDRNGTESGGSSGQADNECEGEISKQPQGQRVAEFSWDKSTQALILSAFFYGFVASQIPGSYVTGWFGGKIVATVCFTAASVLTLLIPALARVHVYGVITARILIGICSARQGAGAMIGYSTSGFLCTHGFDNGWGSIFYLHGILGIVYAIAWAYFVSDSPDTHPRITEAEKKLLLTKLKQQNESTEKKRVTNIPWTDILRSTAVWSIFITHFCDNWMYYFVLTCLPMFVREILRFDIQSNGFYSSLPFIASIISVIPAGIAADYVNERRWFSRTTNRKLFQITSLVGSAVFLVLSGYISCDQRSVAIVYICLSQFFLSVAVTAAYPCNLIDMTPRYASFLYSVSNTLGASTGFLAPLTVGWLTRQNTLIEWRTMFWISAGISMFGAVVYGFFSSSELVPWDKVHHKNMELKVIPDDRSVDNTEKLLNTHVIVNEQNTEHAGI